MVCVVNKMENQNRNPIKPIYRPKWKRRRRFNRDLQLSKIRQMVKEINDRDKYGLDKDEVRFRRVGSRRMWEFLIPEGSRIVNGLAFRDVNGKTECLGTINEIIKELSNEG